MHSQGLEHKAAKYITSRWQGRRFPPISEVEVKMLEPDMSLELPKSLLVSE